MIFVDCKTVRCSCLFWKMSISYKFWNTEFLEEYLKALLVYPCTNM